MIKLTPFARSLIKDEELEVKGYRFIIVKKFLLFFKPDEESRTIQIGKILHGACYWINTLKVDSTLKED